MDLRRRPDVTAARRPDGAARTELFCLLRRRWWFLEGHEGRSGPVQYGGCRRYRTHAECRLRAGSRKRPGPAAAAALRRHNTSRRFSTASSSREARRRIAHGPRRRHGRRQRVPDRQRGTGSQCSGTSISSPLWAAYTSLVNQLAVSAGKPLLGFPDPPIYAIAQNAGLYAADFHDITSGNNDAFNALPGYDLVTGWGSPQAGLITALNPSPAVEFHAAAVRRLYRKRRFAQRLRSASCLQRRCKPKPFCLMRSNDGKPSGICTGNVYGDVNGTQGWPSWSTQTLTYTNRFANWTWSGKRHDDANADQPQQRPGNER